MAPRMARATPVVPIRSGGVPACGASVANHHRVSVGVVPSNPKVSRSSTLESGSNSAVSDPSSAARPPSGPSSHHDVALPRAASVSPTATKDQATRAVDNRNRPTTNPAHTYAIHGKAGYKPVHNNSDNNPPGSENNAPKLGFRPSTSPNPDRTTCDNTGTATAAHTPTTTTHRVGNNTTGIANTNNTA